MEGIDPGALSLQVKQRMDELFPDGTGPLSGQEAAGGAADYSLAAARRILTSLELKSQLERVREYLNELIRLQGLFARDMHLRALVQVQAALCRYLLHHPHRLESRALALLSEGFAGLERLSGVEAMPGVEKERQVRVLINAVATWKKSLHAPQTRGRAPAAAETARERSDDPGSGPARRAGARRVLPDTGGGHRRAEAYFSARNGRAAG